MTPTSLHGAARPAAQQPEEYEQLVSRNAVVIQDELQQRIRQARLLLVGCGLASRIAELAARLGFMHFQLWDGDVVEASNLNRQAFTVSQLGHNKAEATANLLQSINPACVCAVHPRRLAVEDVATALQGADLVVNTADFDEVNYAVCDQAVARGLPCVFTLNVGFGGLCLTFTGSSVRLAELTGGTFTADELQFLDGLLRGVQGFRPSQRFWELMPRLLQAKAQTGYHPQNAVAASITAALVCHTLVRLLEPHSEPVTAPQVLHFDPDALYERQADRALARTPKSLAALATN